MWYIGITRPAFVPILVFYVIASGGEAYYPTIPSTRRISNVRRVIRNHEQQAYPGYFFLRVDSLPLLFRHRQFKFKLLRWARGEPPVQFSDAVVNATRDAEAVWHNSVSKNIPQKVKINVGQNVIFLSGAFAGMRGTVVNSSGNFADIDVSGMRIKINALLFSGDGVEIKIA